MHLDTYRLLLMDSADALASRLDHEGRLELIEKCGRATTAAELDAVSDRIMEAFYTSAGMDRLMGDVRGAA